MLDRGMSVSKPRFPLLWGTGNHTLYNGRRIPLHLNPTGELATGRQVGIV